MQIATVENNVLAAIDIITLSPEKYVAEVYSDFNVKLEAAIVKVVDVAYDITTTAGMKTAVECRALFRDLRIATNKERQARKAPITAIGKLLESGYAELEAKITPHEEKYDGDIKAEESRKEAAKQAAIALEIERVKAIEACIDAIRNAPMAMLGAKSMVIFQEAQRLEHLEIDSAFQEYQADAEAVRKAALASLRSAFGVTKKAEDDAANLAAERLAFEEDQNRIKKERAEFQKKQDAEIAFAKAEAKKVKDAQEADSKRQDAERVAAMAEVAAAKKKLEDDQAAFNAKIKAQQDKEDAEAARIRAAVEIVDEIISIESAPAIKTSKQVADQIVAAVIAQDQHDNRPSDTELINCIVDVYGIEFSTAKCWLSEIDFSK